jgi:hypothetical protein
MTTDASIRELTPEEIAAVTGGAGNSESAGFGVDTARAATDFAHPNVPNDGTTHALEIGGIGQKGNVPGFPSLGRCTANPCP